MQTIKMLKDREIQDYRSTYNDIRDWVASQKYGKEADQTTINWDDISFEVDLLKEQEINLDYILELIFNNNKQNKNWLIAEVRRVIRASLGHRAKASLVVDFIEQTNLAEINDKPHILEKFYKFASAQQEQEEKEIIETEQLNPKKAKNFINNSLEQGYVSENGTELSDALPKINRLKPEYTSTKERVFKKIAKLVDKFKQIR